MATSALIIEPLARLDLALLHSLQEPRAFTLESHRLHTSHDVLYAMCDVIVIVVGT
jgi:hypothetical protein